MDDDNDYELEYSDDSASEQEDVALENQYYSGKTAKSDNNIVEALRLFGEIYKTEHDQGVKSDWGFKALKQMTKINFRQENYETMLGHYKNLLTYIESGVTKNYAEKSINSILEYVSTSKQTDLLLQFYQITLGALKTANNERLWFKTSLKLGKLYFDQREFDKLQEILKQLWGSCKTEEGAEDQKKSTQLLELYALEIQLHTEMKNDKALNKLYLQAINIKGGIPHPLIMGTIQECGGKMYLRTGEYEKAHVNFFESFKSYDESGSARRIHCLKYVVLAAMLMKSKINPFDNQETKAFLDEPDIALMKKLVDAYQGKELVLFEQIIAENMEKISKDTFLSEFLDDLYRNIRIEVILSIISAYKRIRISYLADHLKITENELMPLLIEIIQNGTCKLKIDQVRGVLDTPANEYANIDETRYKAFDNMVRQLDGMRTSMAQQIH